MAEFHPNVPALFKRIGYDGSKDPTFENLQQLQYKFVATFPFENLLMHGYNPRDDGTEPVKINPSIIEDKILNHSRGGYCFELNQYFNYVLKELGYNVITKTARILWEKPPGTIPYRSHLINIVSLECGRFLCDVGMGAANPVSPLHLDTSEPQSTLYDIHRIKAADTIAPGHTLVQLLTGSNPQDESKWKDMYFFCELEMSVFADWDAANYVVCTRPKGLFVDNILLSIITPTGRYSMFNNAVCYRKLLIKEDSCSSWQEAVKGPPARIELIHQEITTKTEYLEMLKNIFQFNIPVEYQTQLTIPGLH